jgi:hypothetical protein
MSAITRKNTNARAVIGIIPNEVLHAYFDTKEKFFYYRQFNNPSRRRDFATSFIEVIEHFLTISSGLMEPIFELYVRPRAPVARARSSPTFLQSEWDRFSEFFDAAAITDLTQAKSAYRRAARTLHPDTGGNAADMVALNLAFADLLDMLMLREAEATLQSTISFDHSIKHEISRNSSFRTGGIAPGFWPGSVLQYPRSALEFEILIRTEALLAAADIFEEDRHAELGLGLQFNPKWLADGRQRWEASCKAHACERIADIIRIAVEAKKDAKLPHGLPELRDIGKIWIKAAINGWIYHGRLAHRASAKTLQEREQKAIAAGQYPFVNAFKGKQLRALSERLDCPSSRAHDRFCLNHILQAENAFRRGLITSSRYEATLKRLKGNRKALADAHAEFEGLNFMALEHDPVESEKAVSIRFVPENISGLGNWKFDTKQACRAYGEAYYRSNNIEKKLKFVRQRLLILLSSIIASPDRWGVDRIEAAAIEVGLLEKAARAGRGGFAGDYAADLLAFLTALTAETALEREKRLRLLSRFAQTDFRDSLPGGIKPVIDGDRCCDHSGEKSPLNVVFPWPDYFRAAMRPLDELEMFSNGKTWFDPEETARRDGINYYYDHMQNLERRMSRALDIEPAAQKIAKLAPLIRQAIDRAVPLNAAGEWQLGYYMDKLTGTMVRARQFPEAASSLEEYFALPDAYRRRSVASEDKRLRARLVRCQRAAHNV